MLATLLLLCAAAPEPPDTVVVCPREFVAALAPWVQHREAQGHRVEIIPNTHSARELRATIRDVGKSGKLRYVMLVGDAEPRDGKVSASSRNNKNNNNNKNTPTFSAAAKVNVKWGSEPDIATDSLYADLTDDGVPDVAVGRLTADSREELAVMVRKILDYERNVDFGSWRRQINFVAGVGGFGALADSILEKATRKFLTDGIPSGYQTTMTYGSWRSPYCPDPRHFHDETVKRFNEGCLFWVYLGHGQRTFLDRISVPGKAYHILDVDDLGKLDPRGRSPIAVFLSCYAGAFDESRDCLGEELLRAPLGAVAVVCGSRVTMPYAMAVLGNGLMDDYFGSENSTLGDILLAAKRQLVAPPDDNQAQSSNRPLLDALAKAMSPDPDMLEAERREHLLLFNLLGDPLLRLPRPLPVTVEVEPYVAAGERLHVSLLTPIEGDVSVDLVCRRDRLKESPPVREYYDGRDRILASYDETYHKANDALWCQQTIHSAAGRSEVWLDVPAEARGNCHVRAFVKGAAQYALGSADIFVRRPSEDKPAAN